MRTLTYQLRDLKKVNIEIGFEGENNRTQVRIDCGEVFAEYPNAEAALKVQAPKGGIYPAAVTRDGDMILWTVRDCDVANNGNGEYQLTFTDGETVVKSCRGRIHIDKSLKGSGTAPSGVQDWLDRAEEVLEGVEAAEIHQPMIGLDGYWYKWDQEEQQYVSTGTKAQGEDGDPGQPGTDATPDLITKDYADLTFPVAKDSFCYHDGKLYQSKQDIQTAEAWTAAHWQETTVEEQLGGVKSALTLITEDYGTTKEWIPVQLASPLDVKEHYRSGGSVGNTVGKTSASSTGFTSSSVTSCIINAFTCEANKQYRLKVTNGTTPAQIAERGCIVIAQDKTGTVNNIVVEAFPKTNTASAVDIFEFKPSYSGYVYFNVDANYQSISVEEYSEVGAGKTAVDKVARDDIKRFILHDDITPELTFESGTFDYTLEDATGEGYRSEVITGVKDCAVCIKVDAGYTAMFGNGTDSLVTVHGSFVYHSTKDNLRLWISDTVANSGFEVRIYKEKGHRGIYDVIVAASDSSDTDKEIADIVCDGHNDEVDLQFAVNWNFERRIGGSKRDATNVLLLPGNYNIDEFSIKETLYGVETVATYAVMVGNDRFTGATGYFYSAAIHGTSDQGHLTSGTVAKINVTNNALTTLSNEVENVLIGVARAGASTGGRIHMNSLCIEVKNLSIFTNGGDNKIIALDGYTAGGSVFENNDVWAVSSTNIATATIAAFPVGSVGIRAGDGSCLGVRQSIKGNRISGYNEGIAVVGEHFIVQDNLELRCTYGFTIGNKSHNGAIWHPNNFIGNSVEQCYTMGKLGSSVTKGTLIYIGGSVENIIIYNSEETDAMLPIVVASDSKWRGRIESDSLASPYNESMFESGKGTGFEQIIYPW